MPKMLSDHKLRQEIYLTLGPKESVPFKRKIVTESSPDELAGEIVSYFHRDREELVFPAKAYAVAIIYAVLLEEYFGVGMRESLNDPNLFRGTMDFYRTWSQDPHVYQMALQGLPDLSARWLETSPIRQVQASVRCFHEEFYTDCPDMERVMAKANSLI